MILCGETLVQQALRNGINTFAASLAQFVPDVYYQYSSNDQTRITGWFAGQKQLPVIIGYAMGTQVEPLIAITLAVEDELREDQAIGSIGQMQYGDPTTGTPFQAQYATYVRSVYRCDCVSPNQEFVMWLQALVKWCLYTQRAWLEYPFVTTTDVGPQALLNQKVSCSALEPYQPAIREESTFSYTRAVTLTADHFDTWNTVPSSNLITSVDVPTLDATTFQITS